MTACVVACYGLLADCADPCVDYYFFSKYLDPFGQQNDATSSNENRINTCFNVLRYVSWYCNYGDGVSQPYDLKANITTELNFILSQKRKKRDGLFVEAPDIYELMYNKTDYLYNEVLKKIYWNVNKKLDLLAFKLGANRFEFEFRKIRTTVEWVIHRIYLILPFFAANFCPHRDDDECPETCYNYQDNTDHDKIDSGRANLRTTCPLSCPNCGGGWPPCALNLYGGTLVTDKSCEEDTDALCFHKV